MKSANKQSLTLRAMAIITASLVSQTIAAQPLLIKAGWLFDGTHFLKGQAVLVKNGKIDQVAPASAINADGARVISVAGGTILPGFIDMHTHHLINGVPPRRMLEHGVTTARDLGSSEPLAPASTLNQRYQLDQFLSGPIIQTAGGYPNVVFPGSGIEVNGEANVRAKVDSLIAQGASVIALSLETGGEFGAPWSWHEPASPAPWPTLSDAELNAIVDQAHNQGVKVAAYLGDSASALRALNAGVDEWAHSPCNPLSTEVLEHPGVVSLAIDGTLDTEVKCNGALDNAAALAAKGAKLFYATDMGHPDIPQGIDAQEIHMEIQAGFRHGLSYIDAITQALASATREAGDYLGLAPLGQIVPGAPADLIVIDADVRANFKELENPRLVLKGGRQVILRAKGE